MQHEKFLDKMNAAGDAYVYFTSPVSGKQKYHICTADLDNCVYIQNKHNKRGALIAAKSNQVWVFCWDTDNFKLLDTAQVTNVVGLNTMVRQDGPL